MAAAWEAEWAVTWKTGRSVARRSRAGSPSASQRESRFGSTETITESNWRAWRASPTAAKGSGSPTITSSSSSPSFLICVAARSARVTASAHPAFMSAAQARPCGTAGTTRVKLAPERLVRCRAASRSGESAVLSATTRTFFFESIGVTSPSFPGGTETACSGFGKGSEKRPKSRVKISKTGAALTDRDHALDRDAGALGDRRRHADLELHLLQGVAELRE